MEIHTSWFTTRSVLLSLLWVKLQKYLILHFPVQFDCVCHYNTSNLCVFFPAASALNLEGELFKDLMKGYNKNVRPMEKSGDITQVTIKLTLTNLISLVNEVLSGVFD